MGPCTSTTSMTERGQSAKNNPEMKPEKRRQQYDTQTKRSRKNSDEEWTIVTESSSTQRYDKLFMPNEEENATEFVSCIPRVAFLSVHSLYQVWHTIDEFVLFNCVIIAHHRYAVEQHFTAPFQQFLQFKDKQNLIIWVDDIGINYGNVSYSEFGMADPMNSISDISRTALPTTMATVNHSLWQTISQSLSQIIDPLTLCNYNQINFQSSKFRHNDIQFEFENGELDYKIAIYILSTANPNLIPMVYFSDAVYRNRVQTIQICSTRYYD